MLSFSYLVLDGSLNEVPLENRTLDHSVGKI